MRGPTRSLGSLLLAVVVLFGGASVAGAQSVPSGPPRTAPPGSTPTPTGAAPTAPTVPAGDPAVGRAALVAVAREAAVLASLGAFGDPPAALTEALAPLGPVAADAGTLAEADAAAAQAWAAVRAGVQHPSLDADRAGQPLSAADRSAAGRGEPISLSADVYLRALDHLVRFGGGPPSSAVPPDVAGIVTALREALAAPADPATTSTVPTSRPPDDPTTTAPATTAAEPPTTGSASGDGEGSGSPLPYALGGAAIVVAAGAVLARRSRRPADPSPRLDELLEVSRRLTAAAATGEVDRAVLRDALGLVPARGAALVRRRGSSLVLGHESHPGLVVADQLDEGLVRRVAETGESLVQVSASEPAIRNLPAAVVAVPLVGGGQVEAVLLLVRDGDEPFGREEVDVLRSLAPIAAAALHSASQTRAAIEDSLVDPLTGVGNRRRFDSEVADVLAAPGPTALVIVDLDHFKAVNDTHGHPAGDAVLRAVVAVLRESVRPLDRVYRFGGEEFCILLPDADLDVARQVAERARAAVAARAVDVGGAEPLRVTASFGVAARPAGGVATADVGPLVAEADAALYRAKAEGRDRVAVRP